MSNAIPTSSERYKHDVAFNRMVDAFVALMIDPGWRYGDLHDAWALAEHIKAEREDEVSRRPDTRAVQASAQAQRAAGEQIEIAVSCADKAVSREVGRLK